MVDCSDVQRTWDARLLGALLDSCTVLAAASWTNDGVTTNWAVDAVVSRVSVSGPSKRPIPGLDAVSQARTERAALTKKANGRSLVMPKFATDFVPSGPALRNANSRAGQRANAQFPGMSSQIDAPAKAIAPPDAEVVLVIDDEPQIR